MYDTLRKLVISLAPLSDSQLLEVKSRIMTMEDNAARQLVLHHIELFFGESPQRRAELVGMCLRAIDQLEREQGGSSSRSSYSSSSSSSSSSGSGSGAVWWVIGGLVVVGGIVAWFVMH